MAVLTSNTFLNRMNDFTVCVPLIHRFLQTYGKLGINEKSEEFYVFFNISAGTRYINTHIIRHSINITIFCNVDVNCNLVITINFSNRNI